MASTSPQDLGKQSSIFGPPRYQHTAGRDQYVGNTFSGVTNINPNQVTNAGNTLGSVTVQGQGNVISNVYNADGPHDATRAMYQTLRYENMNARYDQLGSTHIPLQSFEWIWSSKTKFTGWLASSESTYVVFGKPGSGKSTLMQYLVKQPRTEKYLAYHKQPYKIVHFFFDYRAGSSTANALDGLLRMFLVQLCEDVSVEHRLVREGITGSFSDLTTRYLVDMLCKVIVQMPTKICAFVDGLDEYKDDYTALIYELSDLQRRTGLKMCLATRPERDFVDAFEDLPRIFMEHFNAECVDVYLTESIKAASYTTIGVDDTFSKDLRRSLRDRAQGVIIWARLAVDEILHSISNKISGQDLQDILDALPEALESMYDRIFDRRPINYRTESVLLLQIINLFDIDLRPKELYGFSSYYLRMHEIISQRPKINTDEAIVNYIKFLLGPLVDTIVSEEVRVRLMHKTVSRYIEHSTRFQSSLLPDVICSSPEYASYHMCIEVLEAAARDHPSASDRPVFEYHNFVSNRSIWRSWLESGLQGSTWHDLIDLVHFCIDIFLVLAREMESRGISTYPSARNVLSWDYFVSWTELTKGTYVRWRGAKERGILDCFRAVECGLPMFLRTRLESATGLEATDWNDLFCRAIEALRWTFFVTLLGHEILRLIEPRVMAVTPEMLCCCMGLCDVRIPTDNEGKVLSNQLLRKIIAREIVPQNQLLGMCSHDHDHDHDQNHQAYHAECSTSKHEDFLLKRWIEEADDLPLSRTILHLLLRSENVLNSPYLTMPSPLYFAVVAMMTHSNQGDLDIDLEVGSTLFAKILLMLRLGANPFLKHDNRSIVAYIARQRNLGFVERLLDKRQKNPRKQTLSHRLSEILKYQKRHGKLPDLEPYVADLKHTRGFMMYSWDIDETGKNVVLDPLSDRQYRMMQVGSYSEIY